VIHNKLSLAHAYMLKNGYGPGKLRMSNSYIIDLDLGVQA